MTLYDDELYAQDAVTSTEKPFGYLYLTTISIPGEPVRYYGGLKCSPTFCAQYFGSGTVVTELLAAGKKEHLSVQVLTFHYSKQELCDAERELVDALWQRYGDRCVNVARGGGAPLKGMKHSAEARATISARQLGKPRPEVSARQLGKKRPDISAAKLGKPNPKLSARQLGKKRPDISAALKGKKRPEISAAQRGRKQSAEHNAAIKAALQILAAASITYRERWKAIKPKHPGVKPPNNAAKAETWRDFLLALGEAI